jgi:glycoprotein endo-alpha-1,2-mannosidase
MKKNAMSWFGLFCYLLLPITSYTQDYHIAAYYYPWYNAKHWEEGYIRSSFTPPHQPLLGTYNSKDQAVIKKHIQWSEHYGIDSWICSWWGKQKKEDKVIRRHIMPLLEDSDVQFAIFYESAGLLGMQNGEIQIGVPEIRQLKKDIRYLCKHYFKHPNYLTIDGKPVLVIYLTRAFRGEVGQAFNAMRAEAATAGYELFIVGDEVFWEKPSPKRIDLLDALTPYNMHGPWRFNGFPEQTGFLDALAQQYEAFQEVARYRNKAFIPNAMPGFNDQGVRPEARHYIIPNQQLAGNHHTSTFRAMLEVAKAHTSNPLHMITITSFNEWHEDTQIEPTIAPETLDKPGQQFGGYLYEPYHFDYLLLIEEIFNTR